MPHFHILTIASVDRSVKDSVVIHFRQPPFGRIHYLPGQYVTLRFELEGQVHFRSYSLCSAPRLDNRLSIGVSRLDQGLVSNFLVDTVEAGMEMEVMEPRGRFYLDNSVKEERHIILLSGGSGITPLFSILRSTLYNEPNSVVTLIHSNRELETIMFREELVQLSAKFPDRLQVHHWISSQQGRMQADDIQKLIRAAGYPLQDQECFLCGPEGLMQVGRKALQEMGVADSRIHQESFIANVDEKERRKLVDGKTRRVKLELMGEVFEFSVPPGTTVLDAAMDRGIQVPHSCKQGTCASCLSHLEEGSVVMAREEALLDFERAKGKILACQAQPTSDDVFIRFS